MDSSFSYPTTSARSPDRLMICCSATETTGDEKGGHDEETANTTSSLFGSAGVGHGSRFPVELAEEIMIRLPAENLVKNEIVSRSWRAHIRNKCFVDLHTERWRSRYGIIGLRETGDIFNSRLSYCCHFFDFKDSSTAAPSMKVQPLHLEEHVDSTLRLLQWSSHWPMNAKHALVSSCDGLLLVELTVHICTGVCSRLLICNPMTSSCKLLPHHNMAPREYFFWTMIYDNNAKRYKVIGLPTSTYSPFPERCLVLEMSEDLRAYGEGWNEISIPRSIFSEHDSVQFPVAVRRMISIDRNFKTLATFFHSSIFLGGKIHFLMDVREYWSSADRWDDDRSRRIPSLLSFDMATQLFDFIAGFREVRSLGKLDVHFASQRAFYTMYSFLLPDRNYEIWILRGLESRAPAATARWVRLQVIQDVLPVIGRFFSRYESMSLAGVPRVVPLGVVRGVEGREMLTVRLHGIIFLYDMVTGNWKRSIPEKGNDQRIFTFSRWSGVDDEERRVLHINSLVRWK